MKYGWSLDRLCWGRLQTVGFDFQWKRVLLDDAWKSCVATHSGVYLICASPKDVPIAGKVMERFYNVVYAGQAKNLQRRFAQHLHGYRDVRSAMEIFRKLDFWYTPVQPSGLDDIERVLLATFGPPANRRLIGAKIGEPIPAGQVGGQL